MPALSTRRAAVVALACLLCALLPVPAAWAAEPRGAAVAEPSGLRFEHISSEQGLSHSTVYAILQDHKGFLWFGTADGLNRYDGRRFSIYRHDPDDPHSLSDNRVRTLFEDRQGSLWIGTDDGLNRLDRETGRFDRYVHDPDDPYSPSTHAISSIYEDSSDRLWIGTLGGGLHWLDRASGRFAHYLHDPGNSNTLGDDTVMAIYEDGPDELWVGTSAGLDKLIVWPSSKQARIEAGGSTSGAVLFIHYQPHADNPRSLGYPAVQALYQDRSGTLWIGTGGGGLDRFDREKGRFVHYQPDPDDPSSLGDGTIWQIYEDSGGALWLATSRGVSRLDRETGQFSHHRRDASNPDSLSGEIVYAILEDSSGVLWLGTDRAGLNKSDRRGERFVHFRHDPRDPGSLSNPSVTSIVEDASGTLWVGTDNGLNSLAPGQSRWQRYTHRPYEPSSLAADSIQALYVDQRGLLWIGTSGGGLDRFDRQRKSFIHFRHDPSDPGSLPASNNTVTAIYQARDGMLWLGAGSDGLARFDPQQGRFTLYRPRGASLPAYENWAQVIYEDRNGAIWVGTLHGLYRFDRETERFVTFHHDPRDPRSLGHDRVLAIHQDQAGVLWVGTEGGLDRYDRASQTFSHLRVKDGLPDDTISGIVNDRRGDLWLSTNNGLSRLNTETLDFQNYDAGDGLQGNEFNWNAYYQSPSGRVFFGGINGLTAFYPDTIHDNTFVPPITLTQLTQGGAALELGRTADTVQEIELRWPNNYFEFEFAALSYARPEKNQYAYKLEGLDKEWNYAGTLPAGRYADLPAGTFRLLLKGSNDAGVWNEEGVALRIAVIPPFWATWWFRSLALLGLLVLTAGAYRLRLRNVRVYSQALERQVEERTRVLALRTAEIERRRQELEALYRADEELYRHLDLDQVLQGLVDIAVNILRADKSAVLSKDEAGRKFVVRAARGFSPTAWPGLAIDQAGIVDEVRIVEDTAGGGERSAPGHPLRALRAEQVRSLLQLPIQIEGRLFGVFYVGYIAAHAFRPDEQRLFAALAQRAATAIENTRLAEQARAWAVIEERNRLARDLHDAVTQSLFSSSLIAEALPELWQSDPAEASQLLIELRQLSRGALAEMRTLLLELRPHHLAESSLPDLLRQLALATTGRTGIPVGVSVEGECRLPADVHHAFYRIAQEALNNVVKHAAAGQVTITLCQVPANGSNGAPPADRAEMRVIDDGCGFDPAELPADRLGLSIIDERARSVGATAHVDSRPGQGTKLTVAWRHRGRAQAELDN